MRSQPARTTARREIDLARDLAPDTATFCADVLHGLAQEPKTLPCKYLYDARGSALFEEICALPEYYLTRAELRILLDHAQEIGARLGPRCLLVEYGAGAGVKTRLLLDALPSPAAYVPVDISREMLVQTAAKLTRNFPGLEVCPVCADYTADHVLPAPRRRARRRAAYFPGSTIGNLDPEMAREFLAQVRRTVGPDGALIIGVDLRKDPAILERAYDDPAGVTAAFNLNLLRRLQRELGARLDPGGFRHRAVWNAGAGRMEMHLESRRTQAIAVAGQVFPLGAGETIHTENSHKYSLPDFADLARDAGWRPVAAWLDPDRLFSVHQLESGA